ncbi:MAG TPA: SRPBCC domain-containing protein [Bacteroidales bacterium]|nr:SRPBCC domain-containing protein [Bacteroidales bacterium]
MTTKDFTINAWVNKTPQEVFKAITNVRAWWTGYYSEELTGNSANLNDEFSFRAGDRAHYSKQKLTEVIPNQKIVWDVIESELSFLQKPDEWTGTKVIFEISEHDGKTQLTFTHHGLKPEVECYDSCAPAWTQYVQHKLLTLINEG